jgi:hypothetical protein
MTDLIIKSLNNKKYYLTLIGLMFGYVFFYIFFKSKIIGGNTSLTLYIHTLPTILGLLILSIIKSNELRSIFSNTATIRAKIIDIGIVGSILTLYSFLIFGFATIFIFESANNLYKNNLNPITIICDINKVNTGRRSNFVDIKFQDEHERIKMRYNEISFLENEHDLDKYKVMLLLTPGLLDTYTINEVTIIKN